jgi:hypothetical protein
LICKRKWEFVIIKDIEIKEEERGKEGKGEKDERKKGVGRSKIVRNQQPTNQPTNKNIKRGEGSE